MTALENIQACVFDAYGTLFDFNTAAHEARDELVEGVRIPCAVVQPLRAAARTHSHHPRWRNQRSCGASRTPRQGHVHVAADEGSGTASEKRASSRRTRLEARLGVDRDPLPRPCPALHLRPKIMHSAAVDVDDRWDISKSAEIHTIDAMRCNH